LTAAIHRHFAASRSLSFVFQQSPSSRLRLRRKVSLFQVFFFFFPEIVFPSFCECEILFFFFSAVSPRFLLSQDLSPFFFLHVSLLLLLCFLRSFRVTLSFSVCIYLSFAARPVLHLPFVARFAFLDNLLPAGGALINEDRADLFLLQEWISSFLSVCETNKIAGGAIVMARRRRQGRCLL
jgi:hypothetical protein